MLVLSLALGGLIVVAVAASLTFVRISRARELRRQQRKSWRMAVGELRAAVDKVRLRLQTFSMPLQNFVMLDAASRGEQIPFRKYIGPTDDAAREAAHERMVECWAELDTLIDRIPSLLSTAAAIRPHPSYWSSLSKDVDSLRAGIDQMHVLLRGSATDLDLGAILGWYREIKDGRGVMVAFRLEGSLRPLR